MYLDAEVKVDLSKLWPQLAKAEQALKNPMEGELKDVFTAWGVLYRTFITKRFVVFSRGGGDWPLLKLRSILGRKRNDKLRKRVKNKKVKKVEVNYGSVTNTHVLNRRERKPKKAAKARKTSFKAKAKKGLAALKKTVRNVLSRKKKRDGSTVKTKANILVDTGTMRNALAPQLNTGAGAFQKSVFGGIKVGVHGGAHAGGVTNSMLIEWHQTGAGRLPVRIIIVVPDGKTTMLFVKSLERGIARMK